MNGIMWKASIRDIYANGGYHSIRVDSSRKLLAALQNFYEGLMIGNSIGKGK